MVNLPDSNLYPSIEHLSDHEVKALAQLKLKLNQNDRLGELQQQGKEVVRTIAPPPKPLSEAFPLENHPCVVLGAEGRSMIT